MPSDTKIPLRLRRETVVVVYFQISQSRCGRAKSKQYCHSSLPNFCSISIQGHSPTGTNGMHDAFVIAGGPSPIALFGQALIVFDGMYVFFQGSHIPFAGIVLNGICPKTPPSKEFLSSKMYCGIHVRTAEIGYLVVLVAGTAKRIYQGGEESDAAFLRLLRGYGALAAARKCECLLMSGGKRRCASEADGLL